MKSRKALAESWQKRKTTDKIKIASRIFIVKAKFKWPMNIAEKIKKKISSMNDGTTFKYQQPGITPDEYPAAANAIEVNFVPWQTKNKLRK